MKVKPSRHYDLNKAILKIVEDWFPIDQEIMAKNVSSQKLVQYINMDDLMSISKYYNWTADSMLDEKELFYNYKDYLEIYLEEKYIDIDLTYIPNFKQELASIINRKYGSQKELKALLGISDTKYYNCVYHTRSMRITEDFEKIAQAIDMNPVVMRYNLLLDILDRLLRGLLAK